VLKSCEKREEEFWAEGICSTNLDNDNAKELEKCRKTASMLLKKLCNFWKANGSGAVFGEFSEHYVGATLVFCNTPTLPGSWAYLSWSECH
jgi:hypothetical protein